MSDDDCLSPIGLDCCSCCLDLANGCDESISSSPAQGLGTTGGLPASPTSPTVNHFRQLRNQLMYQNLNTDKLNNIMRQDSLESVVRDPCFLLNEGICNSNIDQTMLSILLFFHRTWHQTTLIPDENHWRGSSWRGVTDCFTEVPTYRCVCLPHVTGARDEMYQPGPLNLVRCGSLKDYITNRGM
ncbi:TSC22 domain family protein 3 isoform X2 [Pelmatolapia mariae]|uniref:TSC22 domain family protein 3 isoform X2 n=1 Tax=Pelmatolapia mariae TaxID=158779 RepID=UPI002FE670CE